MSIETTLHQRLAAKRVNVVNARREFFRVTPAEVKTLLADLAGDLLEFTDVTRGPRVPAEPHRRIHGLAALKR